MSLAANFIYEFQDLKKYETKQSQGGDKSIFE